MVKKILLFAMSIFLISCGTKEVPKEAEVSIAATESTTKVEEKKVEVKKEEPKKHEVKKEKEEVKKEEVKKEEKLEKEEPKKEEVKEEKTEIKEELKKEEIKEELKKEEVVKETVVEAKVEKPVDAVKVETPEAKKPIVIKQSKVATNIFRHRVKQRISLIDSSLDLEGVDFSVVKDLGNDIVVGTDKKVTLNKEKYRSIFDVESGFPTEYKGEKITPIKRPVDKTKKHIVFTYDDGPRNMYHELIREEFNKYNQTAVFAVMGVHVKKNPNMLIKTYKDGHEIMGHSYNHPILSKLPYEKIWEEYSKTNDEIFRTIGLDVKYLRPPYGAFNKDVITAVGGRKNIVLWNVDTEDWKNRNVQTIVDRVMSTLKDGNIVLFHDVFKESYEATKVLIPMLIEQGYQFISYEDLLQLRKGR